jgi:hypothetical protein
MMLRAEMPSAHDLSGAPQILFFVDVWRRRIVFEKVRPCLHSVQREKLIGQELGNCHSIVDIAIHHARASTVATAPDQKRFECSSSSKKLKTHLFCAGARDDTFRARFGVGRNHFEVMQCPS